MSSATSSGSCRHTSQAVLQLLQEHIAAMYNVCPTDSNVNVTVAYTFSYIWLFNVSGSRWIMSLELTTTSHQKQKRALPLHQAPADILHKQDNTVVMWPCTSSPQPAQGTSPRHSALVGKCKVSKQSLEVKAFTLYCHNTARHACRRGHLTVLVAQPRCSSSAHQGNPGGFAGQPCCAHGLS